jgi:hypothetical protein
VKRSASTADPNGATAFGSDSDQVVVMASVSTENRQGATSAVPEQMIDAIPNDRPTHIVQ